MNQVSLTRYIVGDASPEEKASMAEWLDADPKNMREFLAFRKLYDVTLWQQDNTEYHKRAEQFRRRNISRVDKKT